MESQFNMAGVQFDTKWQQWLEERDSFLPEIIEKEYTKKEIVLTSIPTDKLSQTWFPLGSEDDKLTIVKLYVLFKKWPKEVILVRGKGAEMLKYFFPKRQIFKFKSNYVINERKPLFCKTDLTFNDIRSNHKELSDLFLSKIPEFTMEKFDVQTTNPVQLGYLDMSLSYKDRHFSKCGPIIRFGKRSDYGSEYGRHPKLIYGTKHPRSFKVKTQSELDMFDMMNKVGIITNLEIVKNIVASDSDIVTMKCAFPV